MEVLEEKKTISPNISDKLMYGFGFIAGITMLLLGSVFFMLPLVFIGEDSSGLQDLIDKVNTYQAYVSCVCEILGISLVVIFFRKVLIGDFKDLLKNWKKYIIIILIASALIYASGYLFEYIYELCGLNTDSENQELIEKALFGNGKLMMILQVAIVAPIFEELIFRKFTFGFLREIKINRFLSFLLVAFLFALIHCSSENFLSYEAYIYLMNYFVLSSILTASYVLCKDNIYASILVHMINNVLSLLMVYGVINAI